MASSKKARLKRGSSIHVTQVLDFVCGIVVVALKLFPNALNFLIAPIEKKK